MLIITLASSPIPSQNPHTLFDIISLGVDAVLCHDQDTHVRQFTLAHVANCHSTISRIMSSYFPTTGFQATVYVHRQETIDPTVPLPSGGCSERYNNETPTFQSTHLHTHSAIRRWSPRHIYHESGSL